MKKSKVFILCAVIFLLTSFVVLKWNTIFQRGNPIPYLLAAVKLSDDNTFAAVGNVENVYITKRGEKHDLFQMIEDTYKVEYKDQFGSGYLFSDGEKNYIIGSEIYWGRFTVWTLSFEDGYPVNQCSKFKYVK